MKSVWHVWLFRRLLRLYPAPFRALYGAEMSELFAQRVERAASARRVARLWFRTVVDVVRTAVAERSARSVRPTGRRKGRLMSSLYHDVRHAARRLAHTPLFTFAAVALLGLGIGLNATVFSVVDALVLRPAPIVDAETFVHIYQDSDDGDPSSTSFPAYREMAAYEDVFDAVAATSSGNATWEAADGPQDLAIEFATASYFPVLSVQPSRGRWFSPQHDQVGAEMVAVLSERTWRTKLGADAGVIGQTLRLNGQPVTIIGVGPENFNGEAGALLTDAWLSISSTPVGGPSRVANLERNEDHWYQVKARLAPDVSVERAQAAMAQLALQLAATYPELDRGRGITVYAHDEIRFHPEVDSALTAAGIGLFAVSGLVLLLACANLANLLLVRGLARGPEMAVRLALGAGRARVARLLLLEAVLLALAAALPGLALAAWSLRLVPLLPLPVPGAGLDLGFDYRVVAFGVVLALVTGLLFGLLPALRAARSDVAATLREEGRGRSGTRGAMLLRSTLVAVQVAVSLVLVVGAGLFARSLVNAERVDPGFDAERIAVVATDLAQGGVSQDEEAIVVARLLERIRALPGVERAALTTRLPVLRAGTTTQVVDGYTPAAGTGSIELDYAVVSGDYFETMGIDLIAGRAFNADDRPQSPRVIVVNETAAKMFWNGAALGGRIHGHGAPDAWREVVGVVEDAKVSSLGEAATPMMYYSAEQAGASRFAIVARTEGDPALLLEPMQRALRDVRQTLPVTRAMTLDSHLGNALAGPRTIAALMGAFSLLALLLASLGVYAVVAFAVERRSHELGIRSALGAASSTLIGMVIGETLATVAIGIAAGLAIALLAARALAGLLFGIGTFDVTTFGSAALLLLAAGAIASFLPARRAARADPVSALR